VTTLATLLAIHEGWAWVVIIGNGMAGAWALGALRWPSLRTRALWWFTAFVELSVFVQVGLGVGMVAGQHRQAPQFHMFYGFVAIIAVGIIYSYRQQMRHRLYLLYGLGGLFIMGLGIRALLVGQR
jgi:predicted anti-sigma-YlaC factor YlaD